MGLEMWLWAAVIPVILDNTDPGAEVHLIQPDPFPYCNTGKGTKALALAQKHCEWALQSKRAAYPPQPHRQEVPGSLLQPSRHGTAFIYSIRLPYPYKGYPQENSPVGTIPVLHWLLNSPEVVWESFCQPWSQTKKGIPSRTIEVKRSETGPF